MPDTIDCLLLVVGMLTLAVAIWGVSTAREAWGDQIKCNRGDHALKLVWSRQHSELRWGCKRCAWGDNLTTAEKEDADRKIDRGLVDVDGFYAEGSINAYWKSRGMNPHQGMQHTARESAIHLLDHWDD